MLHLFWPPPFGNFVIFELTKTWVDGDDNNNHGGLVVVYRHSTLDQLDIRIEGSRMVDAMIFQVCYDNFI